MRGKLIYILLCILLLASTAVAGAKVYGAVYDDSLNRVTKTVVYINTTPTQRYISEYGGYAFIVPPGTYTITVNLTQNNITRTIALDQARVTEDNTNFRLDLFTLDGINLEQDFAEQPTTTPYTTILLIILILVVAIGAFWFVWHQRAILHKMTQREKKENKQIPESSASITQERNTPPKPTKKFEDPLAQRIMELLKKEKEMTQKEIRKQVRFSEAKVSMVISELEDQGHLEKVKKGRSNVIRRK